MIKIAVISDVHAGRTEADSSCRGDIAEILLARAVYRLQRWVRPDIVLLLGDLVEADGFAAHRDPLERLARQIETLTCPVLVIPGNHDPADELFYEHFPPPPEMLDVGGVRFLAFQDEQLPAYHARRSERDLRRMQSARRDFDGPIVSVQHVPLFPADAAACPFHYTNAEDIIEVMRQAGIHLAISGHYHEGMDLLRRGPMGFVVNPALCQEPFSFLVLEMDGSTIRCEPHSLQMPRALELFDAHVHTPFAYCNENMDAALALRLAEDFHLAGVGFAEHSS
ncbi:MAG: metallophosphoesterase, partial [Sedimentisphaerales bacterium]|nr:metallophosphoesterase [Sedimentisphaerales bacterium]